MYCKKCGEFIPNNGSICSNCGEIFKSALDVSKDSEKVNSPATNTSNSSKSHCFEPNNGLEEVTNNDSQTLRNKHKKMSCPSCGSNALQPTIVTNTKVSSSGGGYSVGSGCCGYMLLGPLGLLCGACGSKQQITTTNTSQTMWICNECGYKFRDKEEERLEQETIRKNNERAKKIIIYIIAGTIILSVLGGIIGAIKGVVDANREQQHYEDIVSQFFNSPEYQSGKWR